MFCRAQKSVGPISSCAPPIVTSSNTRLCLGESPVSLGSGLERTCFSHRFWDSYCASVIEPLGLRRSIPLHAIPVSAPLDSANISWISPIQRLLKTSRTDVFWLTARVLVFESSSRWHTFLFLMLFCSNSPHFLEIQLVCDGPTNRRTDGRTDGPTD